MPSDYMDSDQPAESLTTSGGALGDTGRLAMQGRSDTVSARDWPTDRNFRDAKGREITVRTFEYGDHKQIRAYDDAVRQPPERADTGQAGDADLLIQHDSHGTRGRLMYIHTQREYEGAGIGSQMLSQAENLTRQNGGREIYGTAPLPPRNAIGICIGVTASGATKAAAKRCTSNYSCKLDLGRHFARQTIMSVIHSRLKAMVNERMS